MCPKGVRNREAGGRAWLFQSARCRLRGWWGRARRLQSTVFGDEQNVQVLAGVGIVRLESPCFLELADGPPLFGLAGPGKVKVLVEVIRFRAQGFLELAAGFVDSALNGNCIAEVVLEVGVARFQADGFLKLADRLVDLAILAEGEAEVVVGLGVIRFEADGFLELADGLVGLAFLAEGDAEIVVGLGVIRFQADGFLELANRLVDLAFLVEGDAEVVVGVGIIRFQADGFLVLADRLVDLAFPGEGDAEVVVGLGVIRFQADGFLELADGLVDLAFLPRAMPRLLWARSIVLRDFKRMPEKGFTVPPITDLLPRQRQAEDNRRTTRHRQRRAPDTASAGSVRTRPRSRQDQHPKRRKISIPIRHRLAPACTSPITGTSIPTNQHPAHQQIRTAPRRTQNQRRNAPAATRPPHHLPQRPVPGVRIKNRQIRGPEQLPQIAAIGNQRVPDARAQGQLSTASTAPARCWTTKVTTLARPPARTKNGQFSPSSQARLSAP